MRAKYNSWTLGLLDSWIHGFLDSWILRLLDSWILRAHIARRRGDPVGSLRPGLCALRPGLSWTCQDIPLDVTPRRRASGNQNACKMHSSPASHSQNACRMLILDSGILLLLKPKCMQNAPLGCLDSSTLRLLDLWTLGVCQVGGRGVSL